MPYKIGCDRGGADWNEVFNLIQQEFNSDVQIELWKL